jgi:hypothetical protein
MAKIVLVDCVVKVNNVDLSDHVNQVTINSSAAEVETTAFGTGHVTRVGGLKDDSVSLTFHQDFAATEVEATIGGLVGTLGTVTILPAGSAVSGTNPSYACSVLYTEWSPLDGSVGDLSTASVTWPCNSVAKATA